MEWKKKYQIKSIIIQILKNILLKETFKIKSDLPLFVISPETLTHIKRKITLEIM